jgi:hypothetical protein
MLEICRFLVSNNSMTVVIAVRYQIFPSKNPLAMYPDAPLTPVPIEPANTTRSQKCMVQTPQTRSFIIIEICPSKLSKDGLCLKDSYAWAMWELGFRRQCRKLEVSVSSTLSPLRPTGFAVSTADRRTGSHRVGAIVVLQ